MTHIVESFIQCLSFLRIFKFFQQEEKKIEEDFSFPLTSLIVAWWPLPCFIGFFFLFFSLSLSFAAKRKKTSSLLTLRTNNTQPLRCPPDMVGSSLLPTLEAESNPTLLKVDPPVPPTRIWAAYNDVNFSLPNTIRLLSVKKEEEEAPPVLPEYFLELMKGVKDFQTHPRRVITTASSIIQGHWENLLDRVDNRDVGVTQFFGHLSSWLHACSEVSQLASPDHGLVRQELELALQQQMPPILVETSSPPSYFMDALLAQRSSFPLITADPLHKFFTSQPNSLILSLLHADDGKLGCRFLSDFLVKLSPTEMDSFEFVYRTFAPVLTPLYLESLAKSLWHMNLTANRQVFERLHKLLKPTSSLELSLLTFPLSKLNQPLLQDGEFLVFWREAWEANTHPDACQARLNFLRSLVCSEFAYQGADFRASILKTWLNGWAMARSSLLPSSAYPYDADPSVMPMGPPFHITADMITWPHLRHWVFDYCPSFKLQRYLENNPNPHRVLPYALWPPVGTDAEKVNLSVPRFRKLVGRINVTTPFLASNFLRFACRYNYLGHLNVVLDEFSDDDWLVLDLHYPLYEACRGLWFAPASSYLSKMSQVTGGADLARQAVLGINREGIVDVDHQPLAVLCSPRNVDSPCGVPLKPRHFNQQDTNARKDLVLLCVNALPPTSRDESMKPHLDNLRIHFHEIYLSVTSLLNHPCTE